MGDLLFSTTILASFLGGIVALLAPCCVSVMLPAYFASSFRSRTHIVAMTLVFALGVGTVILPIGLGVTALSRLVREEHAVVFSVGGALMTLGGLAMLCGWKFMLPMPALSGRAGTGVTSVYSLGLFSGVASSCCAPVLAGVAALSGATASFGPALAVGIAYVFGMVAPLCLLALVWDTRDWGNSRLLSGRLVTLGWGRLRRRMPLASAASGVLLVAMGLLTIVLAVRGPSMPTEGWQVRFTAWLDHAAATLERNLSDLPTWLPAVAIAAAFVVLVWYAIRSTRRSTTGTALSDVEVDPSCCAQPKENQL